MPTFRLTTRQQAIRDLCASPARNVMGYGGSRSGKTFAFIYAIVTRAIMAPGSRHVIFRRHGVACKQSIGKDTLPKVMQLAYPQVAVKWHEQDGFFSFPNGSEIWLAGLEDKDRVDKVLGREFATMYFNEASEIPLASYLVAQTRLAQVCQKVDGRPLRLKNFVDLNPTVRQHWTYRMWFDGVNPDGETPVNHSDYVAIQVNPNDNAANLDPAYVQMLSELPARQRARFFLGEFSADVEHALWRREWIKRVQKLPDLSRVVVAIDPAASNSVGSDETGVVCAGKGVDGFIYILADGSGRFRPEEWARRADSMALTHQADRIIAEVNNGGDMVRATLAASNSKTPFKAITATRGKVVRAEPVAALYEQGRVFHAGEFTDLTDQMCAFTTEFDRKAMGYSPDRVDALVYAVTELMGGFQSRPGMVKVVQSARPSFFGV